MEILWEGVVWDCCKERAYNIADCNIDLVQAEVLHLLSHFIWSCGFLKMSFGCLELHSIWQLPRCGLQKDDSGI